MNIGFTGHRDKFTEPSDLLDIAKRYPGATWISGGAIDGFDSQVNIFCLLADIELIEYLPDYQKYARDVAPLRRNDIIVARADMLFACYDGRKRGGTFYTINRAKEKGIPIMYLTAIPLEEL